MLRQIIKIDKEKCNGCGLCVSACHEGAIGMMSGKAELLRDDYCDGLGNCLPVCPTGAITFEEREAEEFNEAAVKAKAEKETSEKGTAAFNETAMKANAESNQPQTLACGCPGTNSKTIERETRREPMKPVTAGGMAAGTAAVTAAAETHLNQWPVQIKLIPVNAAYLSGADLLVAADCAAYAYGDFHDKYMKNRITVIGCPKLDEGDYSEKLTAILKQNDIRSVTVVRMEVPCCGGIEHAVITALKNCGKMIPWQVVTISTDGEIL